MRTLQPSVHIDRIRITAPCTHRATGKIIYFDEGEFGMVAAGGATANQLTLKDGGDRAYVRSKEVGINEIAYMLEIHCCPPQVLQKHNLFGHAVLKDYVYTILDLVTKRLNIEVDPMERAEWLRGGVSITEAHLTGNFGCSSSLITPIIQAIDDNNPIGKVRKIESCITLDRGSKRRSTYHALTIYGKAEQLRAAFYRENRRKKLGPYQTKLVAEARDTIRAEVKLYSEELKKLDLGYVMRWDDIDANALFFHFFEKYNVSYAVQRALTDNEMDVLTKKERNAYLLWLKGIPLRDQFSRTTAWKYAKNVYDKTGVDLSNARAPQDQPEIHLADIFRLENLMPIPQWAIGTPYYFPPQMKEDAG